MKVGDVFAVPACLGTSLRNTTLLQVLGFRGGKSTAGAAQELLRSAVAAALSAASTCVQYPLCTADLLDRVETVLATCDRQAMLAAARALAVFEVLGCPLDQRGSTSAGHGRNLRVTFRLPRT